MHRHREESGEPAKYYRPLTVLSFWLDRQLWDANPFGFHLANLLLNLLATGLATALLWRVFARARPTPRFWLSLLGGLAFAVHPAHVESVAFISGRTDVLATVFLVPSVLALLEFRETGSGRQASLCLLFFALALLCKETVVLFPVLALLLLAPRPGEEDARRRLFLLVVIVAVTLLYLVARLAVLRAATPSFIGLSLGQHFGLVLNTMGRYTALALFPFTHRALSPELAPLAAFGWPTLLGVTALVIPGLLAWRFRREPLGLGSAVFLLSVLPVLNILPVGASLVAERLLYLPTLGLVLALAGATSSLRPSRARAAAAVVAAGYIGLMAWNTFARTPVWRSPVTLFSSMVSDAPGSAEARNNLGMSLRAAGDSAGAERELLAATRLDPGFAIARLNLGDLRRARGRLGSALDEYRAALRADPNLAEAHLGLGIALGRVGMQDSAVVRFREALRLRPGLAEAHANLGTAYAIMNMPDSARPHFWTAIELDPTLDRAYSNLEKLYRWLGMDDSARIVHGLRPDRNRP